ncbi:MAG: hypothetical protein ACTHLE_19455 [Agriterribacter sp.]
MENILQSYFHRSTLEEVDVREIEQWASQYPYFAQAQFLLAKKYLQSGHPDYKKQVARTALFFNNPHWFHQLLTDQLFTKNAFSDSFLTDRIKPQDTDDANNANVVETESAETPMPAESSIEAPTAFVQEEQVPEQRTIMDAPETATADAVNQSSAIVEEPEGKEYTTPEEKVGQDVVAEATPPAETIENIPAELDLTAPDDILLEAPPSSEPPATTDKQPDTTDQPLLKPEKMQGILSKFPFEKTSPVNESAGGIIPIEPLHTIDYFASQGIKLRDAEVHGKDQLSVKLRSFTEWLKTMKRIHPEKLEKEEEEQVQSIQHMAEHSNDKNEVLTEAMAEVFAAQGLHHKATEVYQKLSLLNPHKKAYFAAKISKLNDH